MTKIHTPEPFTQARENVLVKMFDNPPFKMTVAMTPKAAAIFDQNPDYVFTREEICWIERGEDWYGTPHYKGRVAVLVERNDYRSARMQQSNDDPWRI